MSKLKLFCFPFAGGAAASYSRWRQFLSSEVDFRPIELAARGRRMREANYKNIDQAVDDVFNIIRNDLTTGPYVLYGHSMGTMISFELAYRIRDNQLPMPKHIILSGRAAPHVPRDNKRVLHHLPDEEFKAKMLEMGGTPKEFFEHPELLEVFLPLLKGDFTNTETYKHPPKDMPLDIDFTILAGKKDEDTPDELDEWRIHTKGKCDIHIFEGDHFFIFDEMDGVMKVINNTLEQYL